MRSHSGWRWRCKRDVLQPGRLRLLWNPFLNTLQGGRDGFAKNMFCSRMRTCSAGQHQYPGVNIDLRWQYEEGDNTFHYPVGVHPNSATSRSLILQIREVAMMIFMEKITDKDEWYTKVFDEDIVNKWRQEARQQPEDGLFARLMEGKPRAKEIPKPRDRIMSNAAFEFCIAELRSKAEYYRQTKVLPTLDSAGNTVVKSDDLVPKDLHVDLTRAFWQLKADQGANPDWHPHSNETVQDLVHPSMYPFVYDRSRFIQDEAVGVETALERVGHGGVVQKNKNPPCLPGKQRDTGPYGWGGTIVPPDHWSNTYQWLPANLSFSKDGTLRFNSYINNLHPKKYPAIYKTIERLVEKVLPAWDQCLEECQGRTRLDGPGRRASRFQWINEASDGDAGLWTSYDDELWRALGLPSTTKDRKYQEALPPVSWQADEHVYKRWIESREPILPEPKAFEDVSYFPPKLLRQKFKDTGLQIIVKMASIELTPDNPQFDGGNWHIEGQMNERICATALYYADCENVTSSYLSFRKQTDYDIMLDMFANQDDYHWLQVVHGTVLYQFGGDGVTSPCLQTYGDVETRQGRVLAFPNTFQHRVSPFSLKDKSKPGHRWFVALWLVDPHHRIISTANVPPQQKDWWMEEKGAASAVDIPPGLMSIEEAKEHRLRLMEERTGFRKTVELDWVDIDYSFCEH